MRPRILGFAALLVALFGPLPAAAQSGPSCDILTPDSAAAMPDSAARSNTLTIVTPGNRARLCRTSNCPGGSIICRISTGATLPALDSASVSAGMYVVRWYKLRIGHSLVGWTSEYNTDRAPDKPRKRH